MWLETLSACFAYGVTCSVNYPIGDERVLAAVAAYPNGTVREVPELKCSPIVRMAAAKELATFLNRFPLSDMNAT